MTTIKVVVDTPVNEKLGTLYLKKDEVRSDLSEANVNSLLGRGLAIPVTIVNGKSKSREELSLLSIKELRDLVAPRNIKGYTLLLKEGLLDILAPEEDPTHSS